MSPQPAKLKDYLKEQWAMTRAAELGVPVPEVFGPSVLLTGAAGIAVELTVRSGGTPGPRRRVAVVPLRSEERLRYQNWVAANRTAVQRASDGRFGYLHIPDMVAHGWGQLHRDLDREGQIEAAQKACRCHDVG